MYQVLDFAFTLGIGQLKKCGLLTEADTMMCCEVVVALSVCSLVAHVHVMVCVGANMIRGVAGAGVLAGFDKFKELYVYLRFRNKP